MDKLKTTISAWTIKPPNKWQYWLRKLNGFLHKTTLRKLGLFKRYKHPNIRYNSTLECLGKDNYELMSEEEKSAIKKKHKITTRQEFLDRLTESANNNIK